MHVILTTSLFGERSGNAGDPLTVANQAEADELVQAGIARYATDGDAESSKKPTSKGKGGSRASA
ncbi:MULTISPECIES: hypothetical protein [Aeromonas]|jgi:hypothetical protein|uniref:Uncharacterized protein n=1 Tax=Aeromonas caviae TaxID=648 RepID=A0AAJ5Z5L4_AERCA|nr:MULTISPECIES: hypothetical protein [Aeromonas]MBP8222689.1 hypothetical protein [Aeromonas sp.]MCJ7930981.1 hypothetical protein [Aeromonas sp. LsrichE-8G]MCU7792541.1 hypothetical protein [Aeromonas caviae]WFF97153.1 hypothetical protein P5S46_16035 [Aeromonas caviae]BDS29252.1 hypothetical protein KAM479c_09760 [Aeromonas caviae]